MNKLSLIDQKIEKLKQQKEKIEKEVFRRFYKQAHGILGKDFDPELAIVIIKKSWENADSKQKEVWQNARDKFQNAKSPKRKK
ncbi:MAG: hypothetical protein GY915_09355 [bacterium]|nr:hypothetical protein [bacterium]